RLEEAYVHSFHTVGMWSVLGDSAERQSGRCPTNFLSQRNQLEEIERSLSVAG
ncbi:hypothetical protein HAX54_033874, partial [Datura stramonium]|nr:hypothetical protein [Datura stramonium]